MESEISRIAGEYFNAADIESVKVNDKRIIVTLRNGNENSSLIFCHILHLCLFY